LADKLINKIVTKYGSIGLVGDKAMKLSFKKQCTTLAPTGNGLVVRSWFDITKVSN
jgi:hypothetical protein